MEALRGGGDDDGWNQQDDAFADFGGTSSSALSSLLEPDDGIASRAAAGFASQSGQQSTHRQVMAHVTMPQDPFFGDVFATATGNMMGSSTHPHGAGVGNHGGMGATMASLDWGAEAEPQVGPDVNALVQLASLPTAALPPSPPPVSVGGATVRDSLVRLLAAGGNRWSKRSRESTFLGLAAGPIPAASPHDPFDVTKRMLDASSSSAAAGGGGSTACVATSGTAADGHQQSGRHRWVQKKRVPAVWTSDETTAFFDALHQFGTNFTMVTELFPGKQRDDIIAKFKFESRHNIAKVRKAISPASEKPVDLDYLAEKRHERARKAMLGDAKTLSAEEQSMLAEVEQPAAGNVPHSAPSVVKEGAMGWDSKASVLGTTDDLNWEPVVCDFFAAAPSTDVAGDRADADGGAMFPSTSGWLDEPGDWGAPDATSASVPPKVIATTSLTSRPVVDLDDVPFSVRFAGQVTPPSRSAAKRAKPPSRTATDAIESPKTPSSKAKGVKAAPSTA